MVRSSCRRSSLKGGPRDGEYGDDLDDLNVAHAQVSPRRGLELCLHLLTGDTQSLPDLKDTSGKFLGLALGILSFESELLL